MLAKGTLVQLREDRLVHEADRQIMQDHGYLWIIAKSRDHAAMLDPPDNPGQDQGGDQDEEERAGYMTSYRCRSLATDKEWIWFAYEVRGYTQAEEEHTTNAAG